MENVQNKGTRIINGVIWKQLLIFFFPIVLGTFFSRSTTRHRRSCRRKICRYRSIGGGGRLHQPDHQPDCRLFCRTFFRCNGGHLPVLRRKGEAGIAKCAAYCVCLFGGGQRGHLCDWNLAVSDDASLDEHTEEVITLTLPPTCASILPESSLSLFIM